MDPNYINPNIIRLLQLEQARPERKEPSNAMAAMATVDVFAAAGAVIGKAIRADYEAAARHLVFPTAPPKDKATLERRAANKRARKARRS